MEKTFVFNNKIAENILENYKDFLNNQNNFDEYDEYVVRILELLRELNVEQFSKVLEKSFEASLKKEEGIHHNFSLVLSPPEAKFSDFLQPNMQRHFHGSFEDVCSFETPIDIKFLPKMTAAFESTNKKLRIWLDEENEIKIWGFASHFFDYLGLEIKSFSPGQLLIHIKSQDFPHKRYLVTLSETKRVISNDYLIELLFDESADINEFQDTFDRESLLISNHRRQKRYWFLVDVINKVMSHRHGGTLLFIPQEHSEEILKESVKSMSYQPKNTYKYTEERFVREENEILNCDKTGRSKPRNNWSFVKDADFIAQITAVDGATIITKNFGVLAFGAKLKSKEKLNDENGKDKLDTVWIKEPFENFSEYNEKISELGGMRHQSTAQFIFDQKEKDAFAIVASEDGKVSIMYWDKVKKVVAVLRHIEYLFYGMNI